MLALLLVLVAPAAEVDKCLSCHEHLGAITLESGESLPLAVDREAFFRSGHMRSIACSECHAELRNTDGMHPVQRPRSRREYAIAASEQCQKCHFNDYKASLDGVHRAQIVSGRLGAAVCSDCHGAHDISPPGNPRTKISLTCAACHAKVAAAYMKSVHGEALRSGNEDVPACTDCHRAHDIEDPRTGEWRLRSPQMCGSCHTDAARMDKYGLATGVLQTYLTDFHGATARLQSRGKGEVPVVALCTDCHGVHDIARASDPASPVMKANLLATCRKCHAGAGADFPAAWLAHSEPSAARAPLVYAVKVFYQFLIPFMIGGLALQVFLHLWRIVVNR
ncbi:MAG TPA: cytochrome c3 family protein [Myxococcales bacterium]|nr:cytochrome c3 family protein [Myxococcales bacterium]